MKRISYVILAVFILLSFCACGQAVPEVSTNDMATEQTRIQPYALALSTKVNDKSTAPTSNTADSLSDEDFIKTQEAYLSVYNGDYEQAITQLTELAKSGNSFAQTLLCFECTANGKFLEIYFDRYERSEFVDLTERMKELYAEGDLAAGMLLGSIYLHGYLTEASEETARSYYDPTEEALVALAQQAEQTESNDAWTDMSLFGSRARDIQTGNVTGNPIICYYIGMCYQLGVGGTERDYGKAETWYRESMRFGFPEALYNYSGLLISGEVDGTLSECQTCLELLAKRYAYNQPAYILSCLQAYLGDYEQAMETMKLAADLGNERAQLAKNGLVIDEDLFNAFSRLEQREAELRAEETGIPIVHRALMGDQEIYVVQMEEGDALAAISKALGVYCECDDFGIGAELSVFRFEHPIENCVYLSADITITGEKDFDFSDVSWRAVAHLREENVWALGAEYDYSSGVSSDAQFYLDEPATVDAFSVVPYEGPNGYGSFGIEGNFSRAVVGFADKASAQAFAERFAKE